MARSLDDFSEVLVEFTASIERLRLELRECLDATLPKLDGARACARALGLKRDLGWRIYALATSADLATSAGALPRRSGWTLVSRSLRNAGCPPRKLAALSEASAATLRLVETGKVGRSMLRVLAAGRLNSARETASLLRARRAIRQGCEEMYGVHCDAQVATWMIGPPDRAGRVDLLTCVELEGLLRLRPGFPVSIHRLSKVWGRKGKAGRNARALGTSPQHGWLIDDLSTPGAWERHLHFRETNFGPVVLLGSPAAGTAGPIRAVFADRVERAGKVGSEDDAVDLQFFITAPAAHGVAEVWLHRSIPLRSEPAASLIGSFDGIEMSAMPTASSPLMPLPLEAQVARIDSPGLPAPLRAMSAGHAELLRRSALVLRGDLADFVGFRVMLPDPPIGMRVAMRWRM